MAKKVLIIGGGFGGVKTALELAGCEAYKITLVSDTSDFRYYPAMYRTATGGSRHLSSIPLGEIFGGKKVSVLIDKATKLNRQSKTVSTEQGRKLHYDILVLAPGAVTNYFGIKGLQDYALGIKTLEEAENFKRHLQEQLIDERQPDLNYIIIGGGPTGVELAGALPKYMKELMKKHGVKNRKVHVDLVEALPKLVPRLPKQTSRAISRRLRHLGVKIMVNMPVQAETANALLVDGKPIRSHTVVWTAGVTTNPFFAANKFTFNDKGKVQVDYLLQSHPGIFVIGDNANTPYAGMAQTALHDAKFVARNLIRHAEGDRPISYKPKKPIYVTPVGDKWAAVVWGPLKISGRLGWYLRRAGDWVGYHDVEPWWKATARFAADAIKED